MRKNFLNQQQLDQFRRLVQSLAKTAAGYENDGNENREKLFFTIISDLDWFLSDELQSILTSLRKEQIVQNKKHLDLIKKQLYDGVLAKDIHKNDNYEMIKAIIALNAEISAEWKNYMDSCMSQEGIINEEELRKWIF